MSSYLQYMHICILHTFASLITRRDRRRDELILEFIACGIIYAASTIVFGNTPNYDVVDFKTREKAGAIKAQFDVSQNKANLAKFMSASNDERCVLEGDYYYTEYNLTRKGYLTVIIQYNSDYYASMDLFRFHAPTVKTFNKNATTKLTPKEQYRSILAPYLVMLEKMLELYPGEISMHISIGDHTDTLEEFLKNQC